VHLLRFGIAHACALDCQLALLGAALDPVVADRLYLIVD
jgi:starch synthase